jgi:hypothetical protein
LTTVSILIINCSSVISHLHLSSPEMLVALITLVDAREYEGATGAIRSRHSRAERGCSSAGCGAVAVRRGSAVDRCVPIRSSGVAELRSCGVAPLKNCSSNGERYLRCPEVSEVTEGYPR